MWVCLCFLWCLWLLLLSGGSRRSLAMAPGRPCQPTRSIGQSTWGDWGDWDSWGSWGDWGDWGQARQAEPQPLVGNLRPWRFRGMRYVSVRICGSRCIFLWFRWFRLLCGGSRRSLVMAPGRPCQPTRSIGQSTWGDWGAWGSWGSWGDWGDWGQWSNWRDWGNGGGGLG